MTGRGGSRPGAGRPSRDPNQKRRALSTTVSDTSLRQLRQLAEATGRNVSEVLDELIALASTHPSIAGLLAQAPGEGWEDWSAEDGEGPNAQLKVLVVEDDAFGQELLRLRLESMGHTVFTAESVADALALIESERPGLAIVDLELANNKRAGIEFVRTLRSNPSTAGIPIAIHSVYVRHASDLPRPLPDVEAILPKPFTLQQLATMVARACHATDGNTDVVIL